MPDDADTLLLVVETPHPIRLCEHEQVGRHSRLSRPCYRCRTLPMLADAGRMEAADQARRRPHTSTFYRNNPMNVVGWKGDLVPIQAQCPRHPADHVGPHLPCPSAWVTFEAAGVVVLSFLPQIAVSDLNAEELPSHHRNIDMDAVTLAHTNDDLKSPPWRLLVYAARRFAWRPRGLPHRISDPVHTGDAADVHPHRRRQSAPTSRAGTRHSRTLGRVPQLSFGATAPVQRRAFRARLGRLGQSSPASARRKRSGNA
jgi:hypothetical protein